MDGRTRKHSLACVMIVRLNGGLGNCLFSYAFGRSVSRVRKEDLFFYKYGFGPGQYRAYGLDAFNIIDMQFVAEDRPPFFEEEHLIFDPKVYTVPDGTNFHGCWQSEKYFEESLVREELALRSSLGEQTLRVAEVIKAAPQSVFIHVRRTDYLRTHVAAHHGNMNWEYYSEAMRYIRERVADAQFFVFSDDPDGCREKFAQCAIIDHNKMGFGDAGPGKEHEDLWLMGLCKHAIIPNSSFGWWGAWFGDQKPNRIVIAPKRWFASASLRCDDIAPERWTRLGEPSPVSAAQL